MAWVNSFLASLGAEQSAEKIKAYIDEVKAEFIASCNAGIEDPMKAPLIPDLVEALTTTDSLNENELPKEWFSFKEAHPQLAVVIINSARWFTTPNGEDFVFIPTENDIFPDAQVRFWPLEWSRRFNALPANAPLAAACIVRELDNEKK